MNRDHRLGELKKLGNIHGYILSVNSVFSEWQGRISALLSYDPIAKHKFDHYCDFILEEHEFGRGLISHEVVETEKKIHALIERAIADLEINVPETPKPIMQRAIAVDSFGPSLPLPRLDVLTKKEEKRKHDLTKEEGLVWFWCHCHYSVRFALVILIASTSISVFWLGWVANEQEFFRDISRAFQKLRTPPKIDASDDKKAAG